ncbi:MAG: MdtA/MuxA family multidrug efflux RND transporter periplasmic adaptor subunit [Deltaproteobacteria bacterium]|nr:MdtA/MuxA family multidrug efflux RND transporter periplasmic adaptor subunit [Deltaproteobacteria bacterium]
MTILPKKDDLLKPLPSRRLWWIWLLAASLLGIVLYTQLSKSGRTGAAPSKPGAALNQMSVAVTAVAAKKGDIGIYLTGLGSVTPIHTVTVKTRVDGELMKVYYKEGQTVKKGALIAEIDPRPYQAQLTQTQGQMIRDQALLRNAKLDLQRYQTLSKQDSIAEQQYATQKSLVRQLEGTVKFDQGQIDNAKLQMTYSRITAPVSGRLGLRIVDPGNIIHATDATGLCVITQLEPITVIFTIPEDSLPPLLEKLRAGAHLAVDAYNREQTKKIATGSLLTIDNQIDPNSGTLRLRAEFPNKDHKLFPNQFVNARLLLDTKRGVTVVPTAAIQRSPQGTFVYLVKADQTVTVRQVKLGPSEGDETAIDEGLAPGDRVVVEGAERLREGTKVDLKGPGARTPAKPATPAKAKQ